MAVLTACDRTRPVPARPRFALGGWPLLVGLLVLLPVLRLLWEAADPAVLSRVLAPPATWRATGNSIAVAAGATLLSGLLGGSFALLAGLSDLRGRAAMTFALILPLMIPPQIVAMAWTHLAGSGSPLLKPLGLAPPVGTPNPVQSAGGMALVMGIEHAPLVFLALRAALRAIPGDVVEAARASGAGPWRAVRGVVLPLCLPGLAAGLAMAFVAALGNFGVPALLGVPAGIPMLPTLIYRRLAGFGPTALPEVAVLAAVTGLVACLGIATQAALQARIAARLPGGGPPPAPLPLGRARGAVEAVAWTVLLLMVAAPLAALLATSLVRVYGLPLGAGTLTLAHYAEILALDQVGRAFANSVLLSGAAALLLGLLAIPLAHATGRGAGRLARAVGVLVELPHAVPGVLLGIGCILLFLKPLPGLGIGLYGTLWIILAAYLARFLPLALRPVQAACAALDPAMEEAARALGAGPARRLLTVVAPLVAPAAAAGGLLVFLTAFNELTVSILLWSQGHETLGVVVYALEEGGSSTLAAALGVVAILVVLAAMLVLGLLGRRLPPGVVPWRD
ncbi:ABC transporter permease [Azospirillum picis]|uniref:Iron(III) transport system permease protein n=1 Tax=Azospirillum picis TaxID=488438 RepID=A0ABU0MN73_9PROT|nr:iron ABC transporter permease [Azospirillum picis]MBP2303589.1 iron(III) transport system permease protein [Azospirillum picis]MDQ0534784.1 iron(III) transport system permease protein [Azospirillum picis]